MSHEVLPTIDDDISQNDIAKFVGRNVKDFKGGWPGCVHKAQRKRSSSNLPAHFIFEVKYYKGDSDTTKKASKVVKYTREQLLPLLICAEDVIVRDHEDELPEITDNNEVSADHHENDGNKANSDDDADDDDDDDDCILVETSGLEVV